VHTTWCRWASARLAGMDDVVPPSPPGHHFSPKAGGATYAIDRALEISHPADPTERPPAPLCPKLPSDQSRAKPTKDQREQSLPAGRNIPSIGNGSLLRRVDLCQNESANYVEVDKD